ncbi:alpha/beta fold hydrolase [Janibacter melonis]|uniref:alpha/beta fold hydrolase n=1 Tax=Janibacter melonis TaxID=262209 RepID=UPI0035570D0A
MKKIARACSTNRLATAMSTAEVARDMEMVRRALGQGKLSYMGFSYGTQLGATYANMFPRTSARSSSTARSTPLLVGHAVEQEPSAGLPPRLGQGRVEGDEAGPHRVPGGR